MKTMAVKPIPEGYHTITPYIMANDARKLVDFLKQAFDGELKHISEMDGKIMHAEMKIGDSMLMIAEGNEHYPATPSGLYLYVPDVDAVYKKAIDAGAVSIMPPADQFYGDRSSGVKDFAGNSWWIGTHIEDVSREELDKRMKEAMAKRG